MTVVTTGTRLGSFEITGKLGEGGMGEVYRATDSKLKREVAIKVLPAAFTADRERLARFEREAQLLAQLHHPHIASIFGLEETDGALALVMELVEGEDLSALIARGPLPVVDALAIARQIAEALEAAHEKGIVHRDLKPANVKLAADGTVKVLDFGLAKAMEPATAPSAADLARSPTLMHSPTLTAAHGTQLGVILGTAAYMAPEQARGGAVDKRADIWAFGVILYEMLTGQRLFAGDTVSDTVAAVLRGEIDLAALPAATPAAVRRLLARCLERNGKNRLHDIADARLELAAGLEAPDERAASAAAPARRPAASWLGWALAGGVLLLAATLAVLLSRARQQGTEASQVLRLHFEPPAGERLALADAEDIRAFAISPDGTKLVYSVEKGATSELRLRPLDAAESTPLAGTEGGTNPFFSPDGKWIAFKAGRKLKKMALAGGAPTTLATIPVFRGAVWGDDGWIYFVPNLYVPVSRVSAAGGTVQAVTRIRTAEGELLHRWPDVLPGGKVLLYTIGYGGEWDDATIVAQRLDTGERKVLVKGGTYPRYLPGGLLVYGRAGGLYAVRLDPESLQVTGNPVEVARNVVVDGRGLAQVDVSRDGLLVTAPADGVVGQSVLSWVDREGRGEPLNIPAPDCRALVLSPRGDRALLGLGNVIAILDLPRLTTSKLTLERRAENPLWSLDERTIYFGYEQGKSYQIFAKAADDSGTPRLFAPTEFQEDPYSLPRDGTRMLSIRIDTSGMSSIVVRDMHDPRRAQTILASPSLGTSNMTFSPDGRWVVYESDESGGPEIFVRPASGEDRKWLVSSGGGRYPVWSPAGDEIFFLAGLQLLAAPVAARGDELVVGQPKVLFANHQILVYDVARDGKRFLVAENPNPGAQTRLDVVVHWAAEVRRKVEEAGQP